VFDETFGSMPDLESPDRAEWDRLDLDLNPIESAGRIRRTAQLAIPDALIAATALEHDIPLMTPNVRYFGRVPALELRVPKD
jgi:predicted nucleic acid-binding protein